MPSLPKITRAQIRAARLPKPTIDPWQPIGVFVEPERTATGEVLPALTVLLAGKECPFTCLFCDLWQHTSDAPTPRGAIPAQITAALATHPNVREQIKLYNAGNFFDPGAIPEEDWDEIARLLRPFKRIIVECHPRLIGEKVVRFAKLLSGQLEVALGLETIHPTVFPWLQKEFTLDQFAEACQYLRESQIAIRVFLMLRPPGLTEAEGIDWALQSIHFAAQHGATCVSIIPTRGGNGILEQLARQDLFAPPQLASMLQVIQQYSKNACPNLRLFADLWDLSKVAVSESEKQQLQQLEHWNLHQTLSLSEREPHG